MTAFKIGDIVRLKSGGPAMVLGDLDDPRGDRSRVHVSWADRGGYHEHWIRCEALQLVVPQVDTAALQRALTEAPGAFDWCPGCPCGKCSWDKATRAWLCASCGRSWHDEHDEHGHLKMSALVSAPVHPSTARGAQFKIRRANPGERLPVVPESISTPRGHGEYSGGPTHEECLRKFDETKAWGTPLMPDPDSPGPWGHSDSWFTPEWAASKGLPLTCERCHLPFDRTGSVRHVSKDLNAKLVADGRPAILNTHCPRFIGRDEGWTCEGKRLAEPAVSTIQPTQPPFTVPAEPEARAWSRADLTAAEQRLAANFAARNPGQDPGLSLCPRCRPLCLPHCMCDVERA